LWVNGEFVPPGAPAIHAQDPGFLLGVAVFDTLLCEGRRTFFIDEHLARLEEGARALDIPWPGAFDPRAALEEVLGRLAGRTAAARLTVTPGAPGQGTCLVISTRPFVAPPAEGVGVALAEEPKVAGRGIENIKTTGRARNVLARARAREQGAYEALLATEEGDLSEGTVSNLFLWSEGCLSTPALERGCLPGIVRQKVLEVARGLGLECREGRVVLADLLAAEEVFLTNSLVRVLPVLGVAGHPAAWPPGGGPRTREIRAGLGRLEGDQSGP